MEQNLKGVKQLDKGGLVLVISDELNVGIIVVKNLCQNKINAQKLNRRKSYQQMKSLIMCCGYSSLKNVAEFHL